MVPQRLGMPGRAYLSLPRMRLYRDGSVPDLRIEIEPDRRRRNRALAFLGGAVAALVVSLLVAKVQSSRNAGYSFGVNEHSFGVDELMRAGPHARTPLRVHGDLVAGSLVRQDSPCEYRFSVEKNGFSMPVRFVSCVVSDPFAVATEDGDAVPVMVEGELQPSGFVASNLMARVPSCCFCKAEDRKKQMKAWREHWRTHRAE